MTKHIYPTHGLKKRRYHLAYAYLLERQRGLCLICGIDQSKEKKKFCIDHSHETGKIRGLLCETCNLMLGWIENYGCNELHTKISFEDASKNDRYMTQELYDDIQAKNTRWIATRKDKVIEYLQLPGLNEAITAYCNAFIRPRRTS